MVARHRVLYNPISQVTSHHVAIPGEAIPWQGKGCAVGSRGALEKAVPRKVGAAQEAPCLGHLPGISIILSLTCSKSVT